MVGLNKVINMDLTYLRDQIFHILVVVFLPIPIMSLAILLARHAAFHVLHSTPLTPIHDLHSPATPLSVVSPPSSCVQLPGDVSPVTLLSSSG